MTILSVAYPLLPVGPDAAGGTEQILHLLERGLVQAGRRSIVIAAAGSQVGGELVETPAFTGEMTEEVRREAQTVHRRSIEDVLHGGGVDLVHLHGLDFHTYLPNGRVRKLATLHLPATWYPGWIFEAPALHLNCVSESQADSIPGRVKPPVVANGIHVQKYQCAPRGACEHLLWIGRVCPEKGVHIALEAAHRLDLPMVVAGPVHPFHDHQVYFSDCVRPLLDARRTYVGPVGLEQKIKLLSNAICLLIPSLVAETSSLVAMEAISSGTPVIAFRSGALPEVVEDGKTGFIVDSQEQIVQAIERVHEISPEVCRETAKSRFDASRMVADYIRLYESQLL